MDRRKFLKRIGLGSLALGVGSFIIKGAEKEEILKLEPERPTPIEVAAIKKKVETEAEKIFREEGLKFHVSNIAGTFKEINFRPNDIICIKKD